MTEITGNNVASTARHMIDPVMFFLALVLSPLIVTASTFWIFAIPVFALVLGGPVYLITATPVLLWWLSRRDPKVGQIAVLGFVVNLVACGFIWVFQFIDGVRQPGDLALVYLIFGSVFAPVWAGVFASLYRRFRRPFFAQTA